MPFITTEDLTVQVRAEVMAVLSHGDATAFDKAQLAAQEEMESYLKTRSGSNVHLIFDAVGANRNPAIMMYMIDMALYHLHSNISPRQIPQLRTDRYDNAIEWLDKVSRGKLNPNIPEPPDEAAGTMFRVGSETKYTSNY